MDYINAYDYDIYKSFIKNVFKDSIFFELVSKSTDFGSIPYSDEGLKMCSQLYSFSGEISESTKDHLSQILEVFSKELVELEDGEDKELLNFNPEKFFFNTENSSGAEFLFRIFYFFAFMVYTTKSQTPFDSLLPSIDFMSLTKDFTLLEDLKLNQYLVSGIEPQLLKSITPLDISLYPDHLLFEFVLLKGKYYHKADLIKMIDASSALSGALDKQDLETNTDDSHILPQTKRKIRLGKQQLPSNS